jgi:hypothetical protein
LIFFKELPFRIEGGTFMKRKIKPIVFLVFFASLFVPRMLPNVQAREECSLATLEGEYLVTGETVARFDQRDDPTFPRLAVAVWDFDGNGRLIGFTTQNQGGQITRQNVNAIYTMDSERCVATVTFAGNQQFEMVITRDGSEGAGIRVDLDGMGLANFTPRFIKRR